MSTRSTMLLRTLLCLTVALVAAQLTGCASSSGSSIAEVTKARQQRELAHPDHWRNRLAPESETVLIGPIPVGDRRVTLKARPVPLSRGNSRLPEIRYELTTLGFGDHTFYELVDSDTGEVILPLDYWQIMPVPGVGVFVQKPYERMSNYGARNGKFAAQPWRKLDLATGEMPATDIYLAESFVTPAEDRGYAGIPDPFTQVTALCRYDPGSTAERPLTQMEVYPVYEAGTEPITQPLVYSRVVGPPHLSPFLGVGKFSALAGVDQKDQPMTLLLDEQLRYVLDTDKPIQKFYYITTGNALPIGKILRYLGTRAPGTDAADDLWVFLDENGRFGAPAGVVGYRPLSDKWDPDPKPDLTTKSVPYRVDLWLVRKATTQTTPYTDYPSGGRSYNARWTMVRGDFTALSNAPRIWDLQLVRVPWINRLQDGLNPYDPPSDQQHDCIFMACVQWEKWSIVSPFGAVKADGSFEKVFAEVDDPAEVVPKLTYMHQNEIATRAKIQKVRDDYLAQKAEEARQMRMATINQSWHYCLADGNYAWCISVADERGGNSWYELAKAMDRPSVEFLNQAMGRITLENHKQDLQRMIAGAKERESQEASAQFERQKETDRLYWLARHPPDPGSRFGSGGGGDGGGSSSGGGSSVGGGMTAGWKVSDDQKRAYVKALGVSQHRTNMGWSNPYPY